MTDHVKERARMLAEAGYAAMVEDIFGEPVRDRMHAMELMRGLSDDPATLRHRGGRGPATVEGGGDQVDAGRMAAIGFCFGGTTVLELARSGADIGCVVALHGILATRMPALPGTVTARVLACVGARDPLITASQRDAFVTEMRNAGVEWQMLLLGKAGHSFTNRAADGAAMPGFAYDADSDRLSWQAMLGMLEATLLGGAGRP